ARRRRRERRARTRPSGRGGRWLPCRFSVAGLGEQLTQAREAREHPAFDRTDGLAEPLRELGLAEAAVVRQLERLALLVGEHPQRETVGDAAEAVIKLGERLLVRAGDKGDDRFVGKVRERPGHRTIFAHRSEPVQRERRISADMTANTAERSDRTMRKLA